MRNLTISLEPISGIINRFYAFVGNAKWIAASGVKKISKSKNIKDDHVTLKLRVWGIDEASYKLSIDLSETSNDQALTFSLKKGYHQIEILI